MGPKKGVKMDLGSFLADDQFGDSWADDEIDYASISIPRTSTFRGSDSNLGAEPFHRSREPSSRGDYQDREPRERKQFPLPEAPPYKAKVSNCPWDITENALTTWFVRGLLCKSSDIVEVSIPKDLAADRPKGFAFVEFNSRALLEDSLKLSETSMNDRRVYVSVAAPPRENAFSVDWSSARTGPLPPREDRPSREPRPEIDWSSGRSGPLPPREDRPPREPRPEIDWSSGRSGPLPPREDRPPREPKAEIDWSSGRSGPLPPREPRKPRVEIDWSSGRSGPLPPREERPRREPREPKPEIDWSSTRSGPLPPRERKPRQNSDWTSARSGAKEGKPRSPQLSNLDWGAARSTQLQPSLRKERKQSRSKASEQEKPIEDSKKTKRMNFNVLAVEGEDDDIEEQNDSETKEETGLEKATASLSVKETE